MAEPRENRYWSAVDPEAENNAHGHALDLVGYAKRVLELGPAAGHVTRVLVERGCDVVAIEVDPDAAAGLEDIAECLVGDLNDPSLIAKAASSEQFDVVLAGDVLEHLTDPTTTLRACRQALVPGGYVVISLPNIAHADVALSLLGGRFPYSRHGLLDRTHLRFFTLETIRELMNEAGFTMIDLRRATIPVFETELGVDATAFSREVIETAIAHPESETYQFVVRAVRHDGDAEVSQLAARCLELEEQVRQEHLARVRSDAERSATLATLAGERVARAHAEEQSQHEIATWAREADAQARHIEALYATQTMRLVRPLRSVYGRLRGRRA